MCTNIWFLNVKTSLLVDGFHSVRWEETKWTPNSKRHHVNFRDVSYFISQWLMYYSRCNWRRKFIGIWWFPTLYQFRGYWRCISFSVSATARVLRTIHRYFSWYCQPHGWSLSVFRKLFHRGISGESKYLPDWFPDPNCWTAQWSLFDGWHSPTNLAQQSTSREPGVVQWLHFPTIAQRYQ